MTADGESGVADFDAVAAQLGPRAKREASLASYCTYRVGGRAAVFFEVSGLEDLSAASEAIGGWSCQTLVVGKGSNLLVSDVGFEGLVLRLGDSFEQIVIDDESGIVTAGAAALLPVVANRTAAAGLAGFEWAVGVPGSIGGAIGMNAGGHGSDMAASVIDATVFDLSTGSTEVWEAGRLAFGYRRSGIESRHVVVEVRLGLGPGESAISKAEIKEIVRWRRANQPGGQNAGSVFANPEGRSAGQLIDEAGLKGFRVGTAVVSEKHANFIQADPGGSADDVYALIIAVQDRVEAEHGIRLRPENRLIGFEDSAVGGGR